MSGIKPHVCYACGCMGPSSRCTGCKIALYCSAECQRSDWLKKHKYVCKQSCAICLEEFALSDGSKPAWRVAVSETTPSSENLELPVEDDHRHMFIPQFNPFERVEILEQCTHAFHTECINEWRRSDGNPQVTSCPICRRTEKVHRVFGLSRTPFADFLCQTVASSEHFGPSSVRNVFTYNKKFPIPVERKGDVMNFNEINVFIVRNSTLEKFDEILVRYNRKRTPGLPLYAYNENCLLFFRAQNDDEKHEPMDWTIEDIENRPYFTPTSVQLCLKDFAQTRLFSSSFIITVNSSEHTRVLYHIFRELVKNFGDNVEASSKFIKDAPVELVPFPCDNFSHKLLLLRDPTDIEIFAQSFGSDVYASISRVARNLSENYTHSLKEHLYFNKNGADFTMCTEFQLRLHIVCIRLTMKICNACCRIQKSLHSATFPNGMPILVCKNCYCTCYCSMECARFDWIAHKVWCKEGGNDLGPFGIKFGC